MVRPCVAEKHDKASDEMQSTLACIDWDVIGEAWDRLPHDGGSKIPGFDGRFFRVEPNNADGQTSAHRTFCAQGRYAVP
jgi:hypothetical protein